MSAPAVAVSKDGKKTGSAWMDESSGKGERRVYWSLDRGSAAAIVGPVDPAGEGTQDHPALAITKHDVFWAAWDVKHRGGRRRVWFRSSRENSPPTGVTEDALGDCAYPALAAGGEVVGLVFEARREPGAVAFLRLE